MKKSELVFTILLIPLDLLMIFLAFWLAFSLRGALAPFYSDIPILDYLKLIFALSPLWILFFALSGLYSPKSNIKFTSEIQKIFLAVSASIATVLALGYFLPNQVINISIPDPIFPAKSIPLYGWLFAFVFVCFGRLLIAKIKQHQGLGENLLIIGPKRNALKIQHELSFSGTQYRLVGTVGSYKIPAVKSFKSWQDFSTTKNKPSIDSVIIADYELETEKKLAIKRFADKNFWSVKIIPQSIELSSTRSTMSAIGTIPLVEIQRTPLFGWGLVYKRLSDIILSTLGLIVLSPVFLLIAILVKATSPGPILFSHQRIGLEGKKFRVFKFRTMLNNSDKIFKAALKDPKIKKEWQENYKLKNDPRLTKIGKFLRRTSIDELPQLLNVLKGEMSLVGPRPISQDELKRYGNNQGIFLSLKPGLTGLWQVSGRSDLAYGERINLDIYYIENWSPMLDILILLRTIPRIGKGAY